MRSETNGEPADQASPVDAYNVVWDCPSEDSAGSMPLGNGDIGLNAWVEPSGDLVFYISKTDSWDDNGRLLKVGRVRVRVCPSPVAGGGAFEQVLRLSEATMTASWGGPDPAVRLSVWVDANHPVVHVAADSREPVEVSASVELWRTEPYTLPGLEPSDTMVDDPAAPPVVVEPDTVLTGLGDRIGWLHRNVKSVGPAVAAAEQGVSDFPRPEPLLHRTFGAVAEAEGWRRADDLRLVSPEGRSHCLSIYVLTVHPASEGEWLEAMERTIAEVSRQPRARRREAHVRWWRGFWDRSWIDVAGDDDAGVVSRAYALQRFVTACAGRGAFPIKFNGSIFTVPCPGRPGEGDYRQWGPGYWWQNTRLPYTGLCASGDFDLQPRLFRHYAVDLLGLCRHRTRRYMGHEGAYIPEVMYFWGDVFRQIYGWTPFNQRADKLQESPWHKWEWVSGLELTFMMLDYYEHTLDEEFLAGTLLPAAGEFLTFFDRHYATDPSGTLVMHPSQALETWWDCTNPMPEVAGLHAVTARLLALPPRLTTPAQRDFWAALQAKLPDLPTHDVDGKRALAPAQRYENKNNCENPELYAVFPFRLVAVGRPGLELGVEALHHRLDEGHCGWRQDDVFMAYLGLAEEARRSLSARCRSRHEGSRFPAFWGPNYDWIPDQCHGGVLMKTLQAMLLQSDGSRIFLLPAWPKDWDVRFKLHAPHKTLVEAEVRGGRLTSLAVTPPRRRADVVIPPEWQGPPAP